MIQKTKPFAFLLLTLGLLPTPAQAVDVSFEEDSRLPMVEIAVGVKAGSVTDPDRKSGLSNFLGHMLLRGTKTRTKEQLDIALDQLGAQLEVETRAEALILRGAVVSSHLDAFLALLKEIVTEPVFPENQIEKLRSETVSILQDELGNDSKLGSRAFQRFLFQNHPYGNPVYGTIKDVKTFVRADLQDHYRRLVRDELLLVVGSGDAKSGKIDEWAKTIGKVRSNLKVSDADKKAVEKVSPPKQGERLRVLIVDKPDRTQTQINGGQIGVRMTDPDFFPLYIGNHAFGGGAFSAKLMVEIRVKRGWSYGAYSSFRHGREPRFWQFHLFPASKDTAPALDLTLKLVKELQATGLKANEFEFAKQSLLNNAGFMYNTPKKRVENAILEKTLDLPEGTMKSYGSKMKNVTLEDANNAFARFLHPDKMAITIVGTASQIKGPIAQVLGISEKDIEVRKYTDE